MESNFAENVDTILANNLNSFSDPSTDSYRSEKENLVFYDQSSPYYSVRNFWHDATFFNIDKNNIPRFSKIHYSKFYENSRLFDKLLSKISFKKDSNKIWHLYYWKA